jgi:hypothetical protein
MQARRQREREMGVEKVEVFGMKAPAVTEAGGRRALSGGKPIEPGSVEGYLRRSFGEALQPTKVCALANKACHILPSYVASSRLAKQDTPRSVRRWCSATTDAAL